MDQAPCEALLTNADVNTFAAAAAAAGATSVIAYLAPFGGIRYLLVAPDASASLLPLVEATHRLVPRPEVLGWLRRRELWQFAGIGGLDAGPPLEPGRFRVFGEDVTAQLAVPQFPVQNALGELDALSHALRGWIILNCYSRREFVTLQEEYSESLQHRATELVAALALARKQPRPLALFAPAAGAARWDAIARCLAALGEPPLPAAQLEILRDVAERTATRANDLLFERWWGNRVAFDRRLPERAQRYFDGRRENELPGAPTEADLGKFWWAGEAMMMDMRARYAQLGDA